MSAPPTSSYVLTLFDSKIIASGFAPRGHSPIISFVVKAAQGWSIQNATLQLVASQTSSVSGFAITPPARPLLDTVLNGAGVATLLWGYSDTGQQSGTFDLTSFLLTGDNSIQFNYDPAQLFGSYSCTLLAVFNITYLSDGTNPNPPGGPTQPFILDLTVPLAVGAGALTVFGLFFLGSRRKKRGGGYSTNGQGEEE